MEENKKKAATGTGKKSKFMTKLEEAMKASEEARKAAEAKKKKKWFQFEDLKMDGFENWPWFKIHFQAS